MRRRKMRKQKQIIIISSLCLLLCLCVGYAAFSTQLSIRAKGNIKKNPLEGPVEEVITNLVESNPEEVYSVDNSIRYYGEDPNNYVYFDCTDINNQTSDTCELWRIMGKIDGKVKLIRNEPLPIVTTDTQNGSSVTIGTSSGFYWNKVQQSGKNYNNWEDSTLQNYLNGTYYNSIDSTYQNMISAETYYLGGPTSSNYKTLTASGYYNVERNSSQVSSGNPSSTTQKIGLMYPSDYGYAAGSSCLSTALYDYGSSNCYNSDYLSMSKTEWLQAPYARYSSNATYLYSSGHVPGYSSVYNSYNAVRPVLYLTPQTKVTGGEGTSSNPYTLG